jgi:Condensation domain
VQPLMVTADRSKTLPLSWAQERIFAIDRLEPGSPLYNMPAVRIRGQLDANALRRAFEEIVRRHEIIRTTFTMGGGGPVQKIAPPSVWAMPVDDLRPHSGVELVSEVTRLAHEEAQRPFDIARGPLLRTRLLRASDDEHLLLFTMHHIVSDGWSMGVIVRELSALYKAHRAGQVPALPGLAIQYADFAVWQRTWLSGRVLERELAYWVAQLKDAPAVELPTDRPHPGVHTSRGKRHHFVLSAELTASLERLSRAHGATLFMTLLAAFQVLLHRYSGQDDICVATSIANRTRAELEPLIGFFINRLVLRARISKELTFASFLEQVRDTTLGAYAHQDVPFDRIVDALGLTGDPRRSPLCQAWFVLQNTPMPQLDLDGLVVEPMEVELGRSKFDLALLITEQSGGLAAVLEYKSDLFDEITIAAMAGHFDGLVRAIVVDPQKALSRLPLLIAAEDDERLSADQSHALRKALPSSPTFGTASSNIARQRRDFLHHTTFNL